MEFIVKTLNTIVDVLPTIIAICVFILAGAKIGLTYIDKIRSMNIQSILAIVKASVLKLMTDAEIDFANYKKSGEIKKSQVISNIYKQFPELQKVKDQGELQKELSDIIEGEMEKIREFNTNQEESTNEEKK